MTSCEHPVSRHTKRKLENGSVIVFQQCQTCGRGRAVKKAEVLKCGITLDSLPDYDAALKERGDQKWQEEWNAEYEQKKESERREWFAGYSKYLESPHWGMVRRAVLNRDPWCQKCFRNKSQQAHHLSYATYNAAGFSFPAECVGICVGCHEQITEPEENDE